MKWLKWPFIYDTPLRHTAGSLLCWGGHPALLTHTPRGIMLGEGLFFTFQIYTLEVLCIWGMCTWRSRWMPDFIFRVAVHAWPTVIQHYTRDAPGHECIRDEFSLCVHNLCRAKPFPHFREMMMQLDCNMHMWLPQMPLKYKRVLDSLYGTTVPCSVNFLLLPLPRFSLKCISNSFFSIFNR